MKWLTKLVATCIFLTGCSTATTRGPVEIDNVTVSFKQKVPRKLFNEAVELVAFVLSTWEKDFDRKTIDLDVLITLERHFKCGDITATGCYYQRGQLIKVSLGKFRTVRSLYHELCHANIEPRDIHHDNPNWSIWNNRQREVLDDYRARF